MIVLEIIERKIKERKYVKEFRSENAKLLRKILEIKGIVQSTGNSAIEYAKVQADRIYARNILGIKFGHSKDYRETIENLDYLKDEFSRCLSYLDDFVFNMNTFKGTPDNPNPMADKIIGFERAYTFLLGLVEYHSRYISAYSNAHPLILIVKSYVLLSICTNFAELPMYNRSTGYKYENFLTEVDDYIMMMNDNDMEEILYDGILTNDIKHVISVAAKTFNKY